MPPLFAGCYGKGDCLDTPTVLTIRAGYDVHPTLTTPKGIRVDPTGQPVDLLVIDRLTDEVEACLKEQIGTGPDIPSNIAKDGLCGDCSYNWPIDRSRIVVKIPSDWTLSCDKTEQVLPVLAGDLGCLAKGLTPTEKCPCRWRALLQTVETNGADGASGVIVTTPNFFLYKDPLIRMVTGCQKVWADPALAKCASPTTAPLYHG